MSSRHICRLYICTPPPTTLCLYNIETKSHIIYKQIFALCVFKIYSINFPSWRRYTFLSHLTTKSKISVRWIKKLVDNTVFIYHKMAQIPIVCLPISQASGCDPTLLTACIYLHNCICTCTRCSGTACVVTQGTTMSSRHICRLYICTTPPTTLRRYNGKPKNLCLILNSSNQCAFSKFLQYIFPLGGDTPFYLISRRNRRFLPHP